MSQRKIIRQAVARNLLNRTSAGGRVTTSRIEPYRKLELPAVSVYTLSEQVDSSARSGLREITREVKIEIAAWIAHGPARPLDDAMDDFADEIESVMDADPYFGGAAADSILESTEMSIQGEGDTLLGIVTLTYLVTYRSSPGSASLDDFLRADVTTQIVGADADNAAHDEIVVQETP